MMMMLDTTLRKMKGYATPSGKTAPGGQAGCRAACVGWVVRVGEGV